MRGKEREEQSRRAEQLKVLALYKHVNKLVVLKKASMGTHSYRKRVPSIMACSSARAADALHEKAGS